MRKKLFIQAAVKVSAGALLIGLLLFLPAGTLRYPHGWRLIGVLFVPMSLAGVVMLAVCPELLRKRLQMKEKEAEQSLVVKLSGMMFVVGFVLAGLDFRFRWTILPDAVSWAATVVFLLGYALYAEVLRENVWLSRVVEVQEGQTVIDTGLYGVIRHPMYAATLLLFPAMPLILGSGVSFVCFLAYPLIITKRIRNEEAVLEAELAGYAEYKQRVRYRLIPFVW